MQIGASKVVVRPAMFVLVGAIVFGIAGVVGARWYSTEHTASFGYAQPNRWSFATSGGAEATMTMLTPQGKAELAVTDKGFKHINADEGMRFDIARTGIGPQSVYLRNAVSLEGSRNNKYHFSFEGKSAEPFPVTFTLRAAQQKTGEQAYWSKTYDINGNWQTYTATIPANFMKGNKTKYVILNAQMGKQTGKVSLRRIHLKGS